LVSKRYLLECSHPQQKTGGGTERGRPLAFTSVAQQALSERSEDILLSDRERAGAFWLVVVKIRYGPISGV
jgi:hypothetical protein